MRVPVLVSAVVLLASYPLDSQSLSSDESHAFFFDGVVELRQMAVGPQDMAKGSPEACANARIAAKVLADANMGEKLAGIWVEAFRDVGKAGLANVNTASEELKRVRVPGGDIVRETTCSEFATNGQYWVTVRYTSRDMMPLILNEQRLALVRTIPTVVPVTSKPEAPKQSPSPLDYDGLIIEVPNGFRPSLRPIITDSSGRLVFNSAVVSQDVMARMGPAQFTVDTGKARAWLEARGYKHPLIVTGYIHDISDQAVRVDNQVADTILSANAGNPFLHAGRVLFVVRQKT